MNLIDKAITLASYLRQPEKRRLIKIAKTFKGLKGIEIGGPSNIFSIKGAMPVYLFAEKVDGVNFSNKTIWEGKIKEGENYNYYKNLFGFQYIAEGSDLSLLKDNQFDFLLSSHSLEHIANPLKAIKEWLRIIKKDGYIIIVVPEKSLCFDHKRDYSNFSTLLEQYKKNVGEDDLSTLKEVLMNHDLSLDKNAGTFLEFTKRCLDNFNNRCMHHYVYSDDLLLEICNYLNCLYIYHETRGINRWFIIKKK